MATPPSSKSQETLRPTLRKTSRTSIEKLISNIFKESDSKPKSDQCLYSHDENTYKDEDSKPSYRFPTRRPKPTTREERRALKAMHTWRWDTGFTHAHNRDKMEILNLVGPKDEVVEFEVFYEENALGEKVFLNVLSVRKTGEKEKTGRHTKLVVSSKWKWWNCGKGSCLEVDKQGLRRSEEPVQAVVP